MQGARTGENIKFHSIVITQVSMKRGVKCVLIIIPPINILLQSSMLASSLHSLFDYVDGDLTPSRCTLHLVSALVRTLLEGN